MDARFEIYIDGWIAGDSGPSEARATIAELGITVGPYCATKVEELRSRSTRSTVRVSAMLLATWLLDNWWRLRWEPLRQADLSKDAYLDWRLSHSLSSAGGGYVWPPLTIASDGENVLLKSAAVSGGEFSDVTPIRYLNSFTQFVTVSNFERQVASFVETVIARLDSGGHRDTVLHRLWKETQGERRQPAQGFARRLEALLGLDPDQDSELVSDLRKRWELRVGKEALGEIAAGSAPATIGADLLATAEAAESAKTFADTSSIESIRTSLQSWSLGPDASWLAARDAADRVRELWGIGSRVFTTAEFADRLQLPESALHEPHSELPFAVGVRGPKENKVSFLLNRRHETSRRFDIARLLGDQLAVEANDPWRPATRSLTVRQKFQRAFAAELLCPSSELVRRFSTPLDVDMIDDVVAETANEFQVSERLVLSHLVNRGLAPSFLLDSENLRS